MKLSALMDSISLIGEAYSWQNIYLVEAAVELSTTVTVLGKILSYTEEPLGGVKIKLLDTKIITILSMKK